MPFTAYRQTQVKNLEWTGHPGWKREGATEGWAPGGRLMNWVPEAQPGQWALELGCSKGWDTARLVEKGYRVVGLDLFPEVLRQAVDARPYRLAADMHEIPVRDRSITLIYADNVLEHSDDIRIALAEIHAVLQPGGRLYGMVPERAKRSSEAHLWEVERADQLPALFETMCPRLRMQRFEVFPIADGPQCLFVLKKEHR